MAVPRRVAVVPLDDRIRAVVMAASAHPTMMADRTVGRVRCNP
jgi:hypothetical protein